MNTPTKKRKPTLTEQLAESREETARMKDLYETEKVKAFNAEQETKNVFAKKDKEMRDILGNVLISMGEKQPSFYSMGIGQRETVPALAGELMGAIARTLEKNNLQTTIIQELEDQVAWFRSLIEKAFGPKIVKAKTNISAVESVLKDLDDQAENLINGKDNKKKK